MYTRNIWRNGVRVQFGRDRRRCPEAKSKISPERKTTHRSQCGHTIKSKVQIRKTLISLGREVLKREEWFLIGNGLVDFVNKLGAPTLGMRWW
jgi:hypothetical protein